jgi:hypothetical protein
MRRSRFDLEHLEDQQLLDALTTLVGSSADITAELVAHLAAVDGRDLYRPVGFSSLYAYCTDALGFSEGEAMRRVSAARVARRFPVVLGMMSKRDLGLTAVAMLSKHVTMENHEELLGAAKGMPMARLRSYLASKFPEPDEPATLRRLPVMHGVRLPRDGSGAVGVVPGIGAAGAELQAAIDRGDAVSVPSAGFPSSEERGGRPGLVQLAAERYPSTWRRSTSDARTSSGSAAPGEARRAGGKRPARAARRRGSAAEAPEGMLRAWRRPRPAHAGRPHERGSPRPARAHLHAVP